MYNFANGVDMGLFVVGLLLPVFALLYAHLFCRFIGKLLTTWILWRATPIEAEDEEEEEFEEEFDFEDFEMEETPTETHPKVDVRYMPTVIVRPPNIIRKKEDPDDEDK